MASTASLHKNRKSTLARIKRFLAKDDYFSTSANQIIMKCDNSLHSRIYSSTKPVKCSVREVDSHRDSLDVINKVNSLTAGDTSKLFKPVSLGDDFGPTWSTHLFKVEISLPSEWMGKHIHFRWNSSSEAMLLDKSGNVLQGFIPKHREHFTLSNDTTDFKSEMEFYVEMACTGLFGALGEGFSIDPPVENLKYKLKCADIAVFEPLIFKLYTDLEILLGVTEELSEDIRGFQALYTANEMINLIISNKMDEAHGTARKFFSEGNGQKAHTLVAMGHCHIDTAWLWTYSETKRKCARSWSSQIELMKEYPEIVFTCSQMQQLAWMKEEYPNLFETIRKFVAQGRFIPVGGTWVEMDGLIPSGESFIRQFFYGQRFLQQEFSMKAKEFWLPDTFGYSGQIPQILKHVGLQRFLTQKLSWNRVNKFPHHSFWWEGIDGSKVLAHFPPGDSYEMNGLVKEVLKSVNNSEDKGRTNWGAYLYGLGDGGGGPTVQIIERLRRLQNVDGLPKIEFNGPDYFFTKLESDSHKLCKWVGELYLEMHNGTYTSQARLKWYNRKLEMLLKTAEMKQALGVLYGNSYSAETTNRIDKCWKGLLLNQFHDVIPGSCIQNVVKDALEIYYNAFTEINDLNRENALQIGLRALDTVDLNELVAFNPLPWKVRKVISIPTEGMSFQDTKTDFCQYVRLDDFPDSESPSSANNLQWSFGNPSKYLAVLAEIQPSGYSKMNLVQNFDGVTYTKAGGKGVFSNGLIKLEFSLAGPAKEKLFMTGESEWEVFASTQECDAGMFYVYDDNPVCWDAWDCDDFHLETRQPLLRHDQDPGSIEVIAEGPLVAAYKWTVSAVIGSVPLAITRYTIMKAESPLLEYISVIDWDKQSHKFLKVEFPLNVFSREATYEIQYGHIKRSTHSNTSWDMAQYETSGHKWVDLSQQDHGVSLLNDSKYGFRIKENVIHLSLLRAPKAPDANCDMHKHVIRYALLPHNGSFQNASTIRRAYEFNTNFEFYTSLDPKKLLCSIITTSNEAIIPEVVKLSHDNPENVVVIRLYESFGASPTAVRVRLGFKVCKVVECDGLESPIETAAPVQVQVSTNQIGNDKNCSEIILNFRPFQIRSFLLYL